MKHRKIAAFTAALIVLSGSLAMPCSGISTRIRSQAYAADSAESGKCGENAEYSISDGVLTISGTGATDDFERIMEITGDAIPIVPPVDPDSYSPFFNRNDIHEIIVKEGITRIGNSTFSAMSGVEKITLPDTLEEIGNNAFSVTGLKSLDIPVSVKTIGYDAFSGCSDLQRINIYSTDLDNCYFLANVFYTKFIGVIRGSNAETYMQTSPDTASKMMIYLDTDTEAECGMCGYSTMYTISDGVLTISGAGEISAFCSPEGNSNDSRSKFADYGNIDVIIINEGITEIGENAFCGMKDIKMIQLPSTLTTINSGAFSQTSGFYSVDIPYSVRTIAPDAFAGCQDLMTINLYSQDLNCPEFFGRLPYMSKRVGVIERSETEKNILSVVPEEDINIVYIRSENAPVQSGQCGKDAFYSIDMYGVLTIRGTGDTYSYSAGKPSPFFGRTDLRGVIIQEGITSVGSSMFEDIPYMYFVRLPESLEVIGEKAFCGASGFDSVEISASVKNIGKNAFTSCLSLKTIRFNSDSFVSDKAIDYLPDGLETVCVTRDSKAEEFLRSDASTKDLTFSYLDDGENIIKEEGTCGARLSYTLSESGTLTISGSGFMDHYSYDGKEYMGKELPVSPFKGNKDIKRVVIKEAVISVGTYAFADCTEIESVTLPKTLGAVSPNPFYGCTKIKSLSIPDRTTSLSREAFVGMDNLEQLDINSIGLDGVQFLEELPEKTHLRVYENSNICYYLDNNDIGYDIISAFDALGKNVSYILTTEGDLIVSGKGDMYDMPIAHEYTTRQGEDKVWYTETPFPELNKKYHIRSITIEDGITSIGSGIFNGLTELESIDIANTVKSVHSNAFTGTLLKDIVLPESVTEIAADAFKDTASLDVLTVKSSHLDDFSGLLTLPEDTTLYTAGSGDYNAELEKAGVKYQAASALLPGDANTDGSVTLADALAVLQYVANADKYPLSEDGLKNADVFMRGDGITGMDAVAIQQFDTGLVDALPVSVT